MYLDINNYYVLVIFSILTALFVSFRDNIQNIVFLKKIFNNSIFRIILLTLITYLSMISPNLNIPLLVLYLTVNTYINNIQTTSNNNYTKTFTFETEKPLTNDVRKNEPKTIKTEKFENDTTLLDGNAIGDIINKTRYLCEGENKNLPSCKKALENYQKINKNTHEIIKCYTNVKSKNTSTVPEEENEKDLEQELDDDYELEKQLLLQQPRHLENFESKIETIMSDYKKIE